VLHGNSPNIALAETHYRQALALAEELGMRPLVAHGHAGLGTLYAKIDRWEQARTELAAAIELYRTMAMTFWLPRTEATLAASGDIPSTCASVASVRGSQNVIAMARYSAMAAASFVRACSQRPVVVYRVPRPAWQWAIRGRMPSSSARAWR